MKEKIMYFAKHWKPTDEPSLLLYASTFLYTLCLYVVIIADAALSNFKTPDALLQIYYALVPTYIGVRMIERCLHRRLKKFSWNERSGEMLVALWLFTSLAVIALSCSTEGRIEIPEALKDVAIFVVVSFYGSRGLKAFYEKKLKQMAKRFQKGEHEEFPKKRFSKRLATKMAK